VVMIGLVAIIGGIVWGLSGFLVHQLGLVQHGFPEYRDKLMSRAADADAYFRMRHIHFSIADSIQHPPPQLAAIGERVGQQVLPVVGHFVGTVAESAIVLLIALYFLIYCHEMREKFNGIFPDDLRVRMNAWQDDCNRILGGFVRGQLLIAIVVGAAAAIGSAA